MEQLSGLISTSQVVKAVSYDHVVITVRFSHTEIEYLTLNNSEFQVI